MIPPPLLWLLDGGIGHALSADDASSPLRYATACGIQTSRGRVAAGRPHSICGRCQIELTHAGINLKPEGTRPCS